jgi:hypothetical protein
LFSKTRKRRIEGDLRSVELSGAASIQRVYHCRTISKQYNSFEIKRLGWTNSAILYFQLGRPKVLGLDRFKDSPSGKEPSRRAR